MPMCDKNHITVFNIVGKITPKNLDYRILAYTYWGFQPDTSIADYIELKLKSGGITRLCLCIKQTLSFIITSIGSAYLQPMTSYLKKASENYVSIVRGTYTKKG